MNFVLSSELVTRGHVFAALAHRGQHRSGTEKEPYILHCERVAAIVQEIGGCDDEIVGALLHDVKEDTSVSLVQIYHAFGLRVENMVRTLTDPKDWKDLPTLERKSLQATRIRRGTLEVKKIKAADVIDNLDSSVRNPPPWSMDKFRDYIDGSRLVFESCRGIDPVLDEMFASSYSKALAHYVSETPTALAS